MTLEKEPEDAVLSPGSKVVFKSITGKKQEESWYPVT